MSFTRTEIKKLALPLVIALAFIAGGVLLLRLAEESLQAERARLAAASAERKQNAERLARIAEEEREVKEKLDVYKQLKAINVLGEERRLEWADAIARIRARRELLDLRYRVERQELLVSVPGKPANVDFYASTMHVNLALLHEEDLLRFLSDLRASGNAFYSVKRCDVSRSGPPAAAASLTPRLRAECEIDLITILDRAAKT
jgi:hypothetical protein